MEPDRSTLPRNGCYDREPLRNTVIVQTGWRLQLDPDPEAVSVSRAPIMESIANPMTKDCQYSKTTADPRCDGCMWRQELE